MVNFKCIKLKLVCIPPSLVMVHEAWSTITELNHNKVVVVFYVKPILVLCKPRPTICG